MLGEGSTSGGNDWQSAAAAASGRPIDPAWAWAPYQPDASRPWTLALAGHLLRRAAFGASHARLQEALADGPQRTVDKLLRPEADWAALQRQHDQYEDLLDPEENSTSTPRQWWLRRMIQTPHPLQEKLTLFWYGYFAVGSGRVRNAQLLLRHVRMLRSLALGQFSKLLAGVASDPATLLSLDADASPAAKPNQSFPQTLFQFYTLGEGNFTAGDVKEAARALTGRSVIHNRFRDVPDDRDRKTKRLLGEEGNFAAGDVLRLLLKQPATSRTVVRKLFTALIAETIEPDDRLIAPLADALAADYDISRLVETMLRSNLFFSPLCYRQRVKSPVEFALSIVRGLDRLIPTETLGRDLAGLGQDLYHPPTIRGWEGGRRWINPATVLARSNLAWALLSNSGAYGGKLDPAAVAASQGARSTEAAAKFLFEVFLQGDLDPAVVESLKKNFSGDAGALGDPGQLVRRIAHALATLPEFQLA